MNWFDFSTFNLSEYEKNSLKGWGDFNEIIPGKMIAFSTPVNKSKHIIINNNKIC